TAKTTKQPPKTARARRLFKSESSSWPCRQIPKFRGLRGSGRRIFMDFRRTNRWTTGAVAFVLAIGVAATVAAQAPPAGQGAPGRGAGAAGAPAPGGAPGRGRGAD